ncbi:hypothetical protein J4Q44_G00271180 [Coregonus suidteri]|uniref:Uncharacterized protein n=1 Tax=Coregonus suidteri TaxID=861788 RepID=A0AAN8QM23_9TELE
MSNKGLGQHLGHNNLELWQPIHQASQCPEWSNTKPAAQARLRHQLQMRACISPQPCPGKLLCHRSYGLFYSSDRNHFWPLRVEVIHHHQEALMVRDCVSMDLATDVQLDVTSEKSLPLKEHEGTQNRHAGPRRHRMDLLHHYHLSPSLCGFPKGQSHKRWRLKKGLCGHELALLIWGTT